MKKDVELSRREELVLSILWVIEESGNKASCSEVIEKLRDDYGLDYAATTVYTFLTNLAKKGYAGVERKGINYYFSLCSRDEYTEQVLRRINKVFFNGNKKKFVAKIKSIDM